jgi:hypothetical protein
MALRKIYCPECGQETQVDDEKAFCFCLQCGNKIMISSEKTSRQTHQPTPQQAKTDEGSAAEQEKEIEKKLEEVAFYYQLSRDKKEYANLSEEPIYYLKAQDILVDLSQVYPEDYRIWWELCKPIDFNNVSSETDINGQNKINEDYFGKALDKAELNEKRKLIDEHDRYVAEKKAAIEKAEQKRSEEEERARQEETACQKLEQQRREEMQKKLTSGVPLWQALTNKDYHAIDNCFFNFPGESGQTIIGIFKSVSNVMYLMAFHIDFNKGNTVYRDQTLSIKFDGSGHGIKFDNTPVRIRGLLPQQSDLFISDNGMGGLMINGIELQRNTEYVASIMKNAKKPLFAFTKYFY